MNKTKKQRHAGLLHNLQVAVRGMLYDVRNILAGLGLCVLIYWGVKLLESVR